MPGLLPKNNRLDYNPNSIINASKKISAIQLENLKNPTLDPDQKTLSTLEASKRLEDTFAKLQDLAGLFHSGVLRVANFLATTNPARRLGFGRKKGGANGSEYSSDFESAAPSTPSTSPSLREYQERLRRDRQRFRNYYSDDDRNSVATPSLVSGDFDDDGISSIADGSDFSPVIPPTPARYLGKERSFSELIFFLIQTTRRMDILITSRVRPAIKDLSQPQIDLLSSIYKMVDASYDDIMYPYSRSINRKDPYTGVMRGEEPDLNIGRTIAKIDTLALGEYGDEIFNTFDTERKKLMLNLMVVVNSWKQNTPMGQAADVAELEPEPPAEMEGSGRKRRGRPRKQMTLVGNGRNFYGEMVNDSRDIPTINPSIRNCPTKYLL